MQDRNFTTNPVGWLQRFVQRTARRTTIKPIPSPIHSAVKCLVSQSISLPRSNIDSPRMNSFRLLDPICLNFWRQTS
jgi:hypothetical protein